MISCVNHTGICLKEASKQPSERKKTTAIDLKYCRGRPSENSI